MATLMLLLEECSYHTRFREDRPQRAAERTAVQDRSASQTKRGDFLPVKSEELRSSTIRVNELCLTSLYGALLPHPPPPVSSLFVSSAWECQLPLIEDAAYNVPISLFLCFAIISKDEKKKL
ncbi:hypothetical protein Q8A73_004779 [Channa argus]|nr:hypothetical protein Q8A73_004779 [Channa argus]